MKYKSYLICSLIFFMACNPSDEPISVNETLIAGKWVQTEAYISAGGPQYWVDVENGNEIIFSENKAFTSNRFAECTEGNFSINEDELLLDYNCAEISAEFENEQGFISYNLEFYGNYFILTPTSGPICIEGCSYKYQKE
ncbi:hypothetical protein [Polaribacter reichenbachii]|nr:hypothetical protein [Polaribacter reichenbachii]